MKSRELFNNEMYNLKRKNMKSIKTFLPYCLITVLFIIGSCKGPMNQMDEMVNPSGKSDIVNVTGQKTATLLPEEIAGIYYMREEEKLARDVYVEFYRLYPNNKIFLNIAESEENHMAAMLRLINFYGLEDSASPDAGVFNNTELQTLYDNLILEGSVDSIAALNVGIEIELTDIDDLEAYMETDVKNLLQVYDHLLRGSESHLKSFLKVLEKLETKVN